MHTYTSTLSVLISYCMQGHAAGHVAVPARALTLQGIFWKK